jgi:hypothetical protein
VAVYRLFENQCVPCNGVLEVTVGVQKYFAVCLKVLSLGAVWLQRLLPATNRLSYGRADACIIINNQIILYTRVKKSGKVYLFFPSLSFYMRYRAYSGGLFSNAFNIETIASDGRGIDK